MKSLLTLALIMVAVSLAACTIPGTAPTAEPESAKYERISFAGEFATEAERARCLAVGGEIVRGGMRGWQTCLQTLSDGGQACSNPSDCIGDCRLVGKDPGYGKPAKGRCTPTDSVFGCFSRVENGRSGPMLCVD